MNTLTQTSRVLITGGSGTVGHRLSHTLASMGYVVSHLSRKKAEGEEFETFLWEPSRGRMDERALENVDYVIHLAGAGIADKRWSESRKKELYQSRVDAAELIFHTARKHRKQISAFISASAIGFYGFNSKDKLQTELSKPREPDFISDLVQDWEQAADEFHELGSRVVKFRIGLVLAKESGLLKRLMPVVNTGLAGTIGNGAQFMSWIHIDDLVNMFIESLENHMLNGVYNAVAPNPVTNREFMKALTGVLQKPFFMPGIPVVLLRLGFGELSKTIAGGNRVSCKKIQDTGFNFIYPELGGALKNLLAQ